MLEIEMSDDGIIVANGPDDFDIEPSENSWLDEGGIRHAVIFEQDMVIRYKLDDGKFIETEIF